MAVDQTFGEWLQAEADFVTQSHASAADRWGDTAMTVARTTAIATRAAAVAEAARQLAFWARGPFAIDIHDVVGVDWTTALGRVVALSIDALGYDSGVPVFVIGVEPDRATGVTKLTVVRPMGGMV